MKILISASNMVHINNFHLPYIEKFKGMGHTVRVLSSGQGADFNVGFKKRTLSVKNLLLTLKIRKILKREAFDAVYLHTALSAFYVRLAMKGLKKRPYVINTVHGYLFSESSSWLKKSIYLACERLVRGQTDEIVVMNGEDYEIATKNNLCIGRVSMCNGMGFVDKSAVPQKGDSDVLRLCFVGEISKRKNQSFLVKALKEIPNANLTLVGDGKERKKLEKTAKRLNLEQRVTVTGFTKNVRNYLADTDIYVSASVIEGLPFNILEAMNMGLPIVASNIKGHRDLLPSSSLFEINNVRDFTDKIKAASRGKTAYEVDKYRLENVLSENMKIYTEFINSSYN